LNDKTKPGIPDKKHQKNAINFIMIKLFSLKNQKKDCADGKSSHKKASAAQLRVTKGSFPYSQSE
jgi:hypothetical protein